MNGALGVLRFLRVESLVDRMRGGKVLRVLGILTVVPCLVLLAWLVTVVDADKVVAALSGIPSGQVMMALAIVQVQVILSAIRWRFTASRLAHTISLPLAIREYYVSSFLNLILPGGMAGDAVRAYRSRGEDDGEWKRPATAVLLERGSGQLAFFLLTGLGLFAWPIFMVDRLPDGVATLVWIGLVVLSVCLGLGLALGLGFGKTRLATHFEGARSHLGAAFWRDGAFAVQVGLSVPIVVGYVVTFLMAADAVGTPLPAVAAITVIPLCLLTMVIPGSRGGWGTREAAAAALWPLLGFTSAQGLSASLLYGILSLIGVAPLGLLFLGLSALSRARGGR
ncbi:MAG: flippase-like domain-containing protein [Rhodospirillum sp.]|nr:flippase-like domain-containing protein [Rhodospirillum sp.]